MECWHSDCQHHTMRVFQFHVQCHVVGLSIKEMELFSSLSFNEWNDAARLVLTATSDCVLASYTFKKTRFTCGVSSGRCGGASNFGRSCHTSPIPILIPILAPLHVLAISLLLFDFQWTSLYVRKVCWRMTLAPLVSISSTLNSILSTNQIINYAHQT